MLSPSVANDEFLCPAANVLLNTEFMFINTQKQNENTRNGSAFHISGWLWRDIAYHVWIPAQKAEVMRSFRGFIALERLNILLTYCWTNSWDIDDLKQREALVASI